MLLNIYDTYPDDDGIYSLPKLTPVTALEYMNAYYSKIEDVDGNMKIDEEIKKATTGILTMKELIKMFPLVYLGEETV